MRPIVDAHTHFFSRTFFETLAEASPLPGTAAERLARLAETAGIEVPGPDLDAHLARWLAALDANGVEHAVTFASVPQEAATVAKAVAAAAGRLTAFGLVNARDGDAPNRAREMFDVHGFRGILLFPAQQRVRISGPEIAAVLEVVNARGGVAVVHCGLLQVKVRDLLGLPRTIDLDYANPIDLVRAADAFPQVRFVVPHFGAGFLRETLMAGAQCANVWVDTSSSNGWLATQAPPLDLAAVFRQTLAVFGPDRVVFGTDSSVFPRGWRKDVLSAQVAALDALAVPDDVRRKLFRDNALRLIAH
jgi:predicted TIM-barrel fold metal-dependent hydrolase